MYLLVFTLHLLRSISDENDFTLQTYTGVFTVGTVFRDTLCIDISTTEDNFLEGDHEFTVSIVSTTPNDDDAVTISAPSTHVVTIDDDDGAYVAFFSCEYYHTYICRYDISRS